MQFFTLSDQGQQYEGQSRRGYGVEFERFLRIYVAKVYAYSYLPYNTVLFWTDMKSTGIFKYWDPEKGPYAWCSNKRPEVQMLRVYKVDCDLASHVEQIRGYRWPLVWIDGPVHCRGTPILTDQQMDERLLKFNEILQKHSNPPVTRT